MLYEIFKRISDLVIATLATIVFTPLLIVIAFAVKFDGTGGPVFIEISTRVGKNKKPFHMYKFRSMIPNAHIFWESHPEYEELKKEWLKIGKLPIDKDPRITRVGKIIRKTDFDELPQLINVFKGEMSIVGPRAPYVEELERYLKEFPSIKKNVKTAYSVKPGMTGIWQISGRNSLSIPCKYKMEAKYARNKSILNDLKIIILTPQAMVTRGGASE